MPKPDPAGPLGRLAAAAPPAALLADLAAALERGAPEVGTDRATARREAVLLAAATLSGDADAARRHAENLLADDPVGAAARIDGLDSFARKLSERP